MKFCNRSSFHTVLGLALVACTLGFSSAARAETDTTSVHARSSIDDGEHTSMSRPNALSGELLGRAGLYSVNYDRSLTESFALGAGVSSWSFSSGFDSSGYSVVIVPVYGNFYFQPGQNRGFLTAGADIAVARSRHSNSLYGSSTSSSDSDTSFSRTDSGIAAILGGGYEYRGENGFLFRASGYLLVAAGGALPWIGLSFGGTF